MHGGRLGLAFQSLAEGGVVPPIIHAIASGHLNTSLFTAYLATRGGMAENVSGGLFTFGAIDTTNCGTVMGVTLLLATAIFPLQAMPL